MRDTWKRLGWALALAGVAWGASGCEVPIRAKREDPLTVIERVNANALSHGEMSAESLLTLQRANLVDAWESDPGTAIEGLHDLSVELPALARDGLFALAELSFLVARDDEDRGRYLASAVYAYLFLFGNAESPPPDGFDHRFRVACDLYNQSLAEAFRSEDGEHFVPRDGRVEIPRGRLWMGADKQLRHGPYTFVRFRPATDFDVRGLKARVRNPGLGAPLIAAHEASDRKPEPDERIVVQYPPRLRIPVTAFLRIQGELRDMGGESMTARLELHNGAGAPTTTVRGTPVRIETDTTTPLAYTIGRSALWDFELGSILRPEEVGYDPGLYMVTPYAPGRIPIVLVHGTFSSPARWMELVNEITSDPVVANECQIWLFLYPTGRPILASARDLRRGLLNSVEALDPGGRDPSLRHMIVIGHSQGGLLTRLQACGAADDDFWPSFANVPIDELKLDEKIREDLRAAFYFEPVPHVDRVIFMSTPHRGSFLSEGWIGQIGRSLVSIPGKVVRRSRSLFAKNVGLLKYDAIDDIPNAIDNMNPESHFVEVLGKIPLAEGVRSHTIIGTLDPDDDPEDWEDGVVAYRSAHLEWTDTELVIPNCGHSSQQHPAGIIEVWRILREHIAEVRGTR